MTHSGQSKHYSGEAAAEASGNDILLGRFTFRVVYRHAGADEGITIHVFGPREATMEEVLRFDCFRDQPHYHLGWSYRDERFIEIDSAKPFEWAVAQLRSNLPGLLEAAGGEPLLGEELAGLDNTASRIKRHGAELLSAQEGRSG